MFEPKATAPHLDSTINGPGGPEIRLPLFPPKRTQVGYRVVSEKCQRETHARSNLTAHSITSSAMASSEGGTSMPGRALFSDF